MKLKKQNQNGGKYYCIRIIRDQRSFVDSVDLTYKRETGMSEPFALSGLPVPLSPDSSPCQSWSGPL